jgi:hypothetical protein
LLVITLLSGQRVGRVGDAETAAQRVEIGFAARRARVQAAQRPRPRQQRPLGGPRVVTQQLVGQRRGAAQVLQHHEALRAVVREHLRAHALLGRQRREQLVADRLLDEGVAVRARLDRAVALHHERAGQGERGGGDPHPQDGGTPAAAEILGIGKANGCAEAVAEHLLSRADRPGHRRPDAPRGGIR